ncbi:MAG TPA: GNAT family N-acetyltransferase [Terriglobales bacterium]|jgi:GNAT superfamily N-acetyltransferase|nr:GNAT family N-acetyltransferase [Terriglobales bacterium]
MSVRLRKMTMSDVPEALRLKDLAGWNQTAADWERFLSASPGGCFAAEQEGRLVGTSATIIYEGRFAWIGMVIVHPDYRGQGIGRNLLKRAVQYLDKQCVPCMKLDATPQGRPLYERFGFVSEYEIERWMLKRAGHTRAKVADGTAQDIEDVIQLDRKIFGADRGALLRSLALGEPEFTLVVRQGAEIAGYAFGRHGALADHLGPWMARNQDTAAMLVDEFLRRSGREMVFADCLHPWAVALLKAHGFEFSRPLTRMFRGANQYPGQPELLAAVLGPEFG